MSSSELRAHLRIRSEGLAIVTFPDGRRLEATVRDISLGGAYLMRREGSVPGFLPVQGTEVEVYLYHLNHAADAVTLGAQVLRVEASGVGFALRFAPVASRPASQLASMVAREAEEQGIRPARLHIRGARSAAIRRGLGWAARIAAVAMVGGGVQVLFQWLDAVM